MQFRIHREKAAGESFREGSIEVTLELWIERSISQ